MRRIVRRPATPQAGPNFAHFFATCPRGLEALLAEDIAAAGGTDVAITPGGAGFAGGKETGYRLNLHSRIATRVLCRLASADIFSPPRSQNQLAAPHRGGAHAA
jgi:23S rRNA G2445 N2-methylase RlmL